MNKTITVLFIVKNISFVYFSSCHTATKTFLESNFSQTTVVAVVASYHALLFELFSVDMDCNCTRTGYEVHGSAASLPHIRKNCIIN